MPKKKKSANELTTDEALKKLFRKPLRDKLYEIAHERDDEEDKKPSQE